MKYHRLPKLKKPSHASATIGICTFCKVLWSDDVIKRLLWYLAKPINWWTDQFFITKWFSELSGIYGFPVWVNSWVFVYELNGCGFESRCCHLNLRYRTCFKKGVPDIQVTIQCGFTLKHIRDMIITYSNFSLTL